MKLAIICNRYHTSMLCKRAPVHLQCYTTSTGTSNSTSSMLCYEHRYIEFYIFNAMLQAPVHRIQGKQKAPVHQRKSDQISNTSIYSEQIHISTNHNTFRQFIPTFNFVISSSDQKTFGSVLPSLLSSVDHNSISTSRSTSAITLYS